MKLLTLPTTPSLLNLTSLALSTPNPCLTSSSFIGLSKSETNSINDSVNFMLGSDPHHLGSRFEGVEAGGIGGKLYHKTPVFS
jgi:hypothetical protein